MSDIIAPSSLTKKLYNAGASCETVASSNSVSEMQSAILTCGELLKDTAVALGHKSKTIVLDSSDFGTLAICAVRYCLGRETYMPHMVMRLLTPLIPLVSDHDLMILQRDIAEAPGYGSPTIDMPAWKSFLEEINAELDVRRPCGYTRREILL